MYHLEINGKSLCEWSISDRDQCRCALEALANRRAEWLQRKFKEADVRIVDADCHKCAAPFHSAPSGSYDRYRRYMGVN